jgi:hypothetical protein
VFGVLVVVVLVLLLAVWYCGGAGVVAVWYCGVFSGAFWSLVLLVSGGKGLWC